jgi:hypothetical protein
MADPPVKLVKQLESNGFYLTPSLASRWVFKLLYEFWGFVINGSGDALSPSGFAISGGINLPTLVTSGVIAAGSDGVTTFGGGTFFSPTTDFINLNVTGSLLNKYVVIWQSGSTSFDDGIYKIQYVDSSNRLILDTTTGGTPRLGNKPVFWDRENIMFRVVDLEQAMNVSGWHDGQGLTFQFDGAGDVNPGQLSSQFNLSLMSTQLIVSMSISPSGTWNGRTFIDSGSSVNQMFYPGGGTSGRLVVSMAGAKDFLMCHIDGEDQTLQGSNNPTGFHVEIPKRLYPKENDPNPITFMTFDTSVPLSQTSGSYNNGFRMIGQDGVLRNWTTLVRAPMGSFTNTSFVSVGNGLLQGITSGSSWNRIDVNDHTNKRLITDGVLHLNQSGSFSMARCRLRRVRFTTAMTPTGTRFGNDWIHMKSGILWPWNNTRLPLGTLLWESI